MLANAFASLYVTATSAMSAVASAAPNILVSKKVEPTALDWVGTILAIASIGAAVLFMIGMATWMTYKAFTQHETLTTSWPSPQEESFASFTESAEKVHQKSWLFGLIGAAVLTIAALGVYFGVTPQKDKIGDTLDMSTFDKKGKAPAPGPSAPR